MMKITEDLADGDCEAPERDNRSAAPLPQSGGDHLSHILIITLLIALFIWVILIKSFVLLVEIMLFGDSGKLFLPASFHASKSVLINRIGVDKVLKDQGPLSFSGAEEIWIKKRGQAGANLSGWPSMVGGGLFSL